MRTNVKVTQMTSSRTGSEVANQMIIETPEGKYFQSYRSIIAFIPEKADKQNNPFSTPPEWRIKLDEKYWNYSKTTGKYRNQFLGETKAETEQKIASGEYILTDLNS